MSHLRYPFEEKLNMKIAQRRLQRISSLIAIVGFSFLAVAPFQSIQAATCCNCHPGGDATVNVCLTDSAATCGDILTKAKNPALAGFTCEPKPLEAANCISISKADPSKGAASAKCVQGPTDATGYQAPDKSSVGSVKTVAPIIPKPEVNITGLVFSKQLTETNGNLSVPFIAEYIAAVYKYALGITVIAAALMMIYGGFLWIIGATITSITKGKKIIGDALIGLLLVYSSFTLLNMLNPETVSMKGLQLTNVTQQDWKVDEALPPAGTGGGTATIGGMSVPLGKRVCETFDECAKLCVCPNGITPDLPSTTGIATNADVKPIVLAGHPGISGAGFLRPAALEALYAAGKVAQAKAGGPYTIDVKSTTRSLEQQIKIACQDAICPGTPEAKAKLGPVVAFPGGSLHGSGVAMDITLYKDKTASTPRRALTSDTILLKDQVKDSPEAQTKLLQEIMTEAGWFRYCTEVWHFEFGTGGSPNRSQNCPWPPK